MKNISTSLAQVEPNSRHLFPMSNNPNQVARLISGPNAPPHDNLSTLKTAEFLIACSNDKSDQRANVEIENVVIIKVETIPLLE